jgi:hypothetical protein
VSFRLSCLCAFTQEVVPLGTALSLPHEGHLSRLCSQMLSQTGSDDVISVVTNSYGLAPSIQRANFSSPSHHTLTSQEVGGVPPRHEHSLSIPH